VGVGVRVCLCVRMSVCVSVCVFVRVRASASVVELGKGAVRLSFAHVTPAAMCSAVGRPASAQHRTNKHWELGGPQAGAAEPGGKGSLQAA